MAYPEFVTGLHGLVVEYTGGAAPLVWTMMKIMAVTAPLMLLVAYLTLWERKLLGWIQIRIGPNRVGYNGILQPIADALKLITKEIILPTVANKGLFLLGPIMTIMPALLAPPRCGRRPSVAATARVARCCRAGRWRPWRGGPPPP